MAREQWLKITTDLPQKPEVFAMAEELNLDPWSIVGRLIAVWTWASEQTTDGVVRDAPVTLCASLDRCVGVTGFADAMSKVGWLVQNSTEVIFPNFERHCSKSAKSRSLAARRMEKFRAKSDVSRVTIASPDKIREENKKNPPIVPPGGGKKDTTSRKPKQAKRTKKTDPELERRCAEIYEAYPKHEGFGAALKAIRRACDKLEPAKLLDAVKRYAESSQVRQKLAAGEKQFIPNAATWMNQERWTDELEGPAMSDDNPLRPKWGGDNA